MSPDRKRLSLLARLDAIEASLASANYEIEPKIVQLLNKMKDATTAGAIRLHAEPRHTRGVIDHARMNIEQGDLDAATAALDRFDHHRAWIKGLLVKHKLERIRGDRGAPKGTKRHRRFDDALLDEVSERMAKGEKPTTAARTLLSERGQKRGLKNSADEVVKKLIRKRGY